MYSCGSIWQYSHSMPSKHLWSLIYVFTWRATWELACILKHCAVCLSASVPDLPSNSNSVGTLTRDISCLTK